MRREKIFYGWYVVAASFLLCMLFTGAGFYSFSIFIKPLETEFGWSRGAISLTMSIYLVVSGLMGPFIGRLIGHFGPKKVMTACAAGAGLCFMLVSLTFSLWYFYMIYALLAITICGIGVIPVSNLMANWFSKSRGMATGIAMVGISAGGLILVPTVGIITLNYGWKMSFVAIGLVVWLIAIPVISLVIKDRPEQIGLLPDGNSPEEASYSHPGQPARVPIIAGLPSAEVFRTSAFWFIFASFFLAAFSQMGILQHQVPMLVDLMGTSQTTAATALGLTAGIGGIGKICFGLISDRWQFRYVVLLCFGLQASAVMVLLHIDTPGIMWIYTILFGFSMGGVIVLLPLAVGHFWGLLSFGVLVGALWIANSLGGALGTYFNGVSYDLIGDYRFTLNFFVAAYIISIVSFFLAGRSGTERR
jgi:sugar phosphate permease